MLTIITIVFGSCSVTASVAHPTLRRYCLNGVKRTGRVFLRFGYTYAKVRYPAMFLHVSEEERYQAWLEEHASDGPSTGRRC